MFSRFGFDGVLASLPALNAYMAANSVRYTTALNALADVLLDVSVNDGGNTGQGGPLVAQRQINLKVNAAPVTEIHAVPTLSPGMLASLVTLFVLCYIRASMQQRQYSFFYFTFSVPGGREAVS